MTRARYPGRLYLEEDNTILKPPTLSPAPGLSILGGRQEDGGPPGIASYLDKQWNEVRWFTLAHTTEPQPSSGMAA